MLPDSVNLGHPTAGIPLVHEVAVLLSCNGIDAEGGLALAASPHLERLRRLDLSDELPRRGGPGCLARSLRFAGETIEGRP